MAKRAQLDEVRPILDEVNDGISAVEGVLDSVEAGADKAAEALETGLEKVADVVPEALDKSVHVVAESTRKGVLALQSPRRLMVIVGLGGVATGAALGVAGYFALKKRLETKLRKEMEEELEKQIDGMRKFYETRAAKKQPFSSPEEAAEALLPKSREEKLAEEAAAALNEYEGTEPPPGVISSDNDPRQGSNQRVRYDKVKRDEHGRFVPSNKDEQDEKPEAAVETVTEAQAEEIRHNVFVQQASADTWDQEREEASRNPESPYVISHDEFMENAFEHEQNTLTYYAGDDILADEREQHIDDVEATVGVENLQLFGHGSRDSNVVYIRNERIEVDFEVALNKGKYSEEVLGFEHSATVSNLLRKGRGRGGDG